MNQIKLIRGGNSQHAKAQRDKIAPVIIAMFRDGMNRTNIAKTLGISNQPVDKILWENGLSDDPGNHSYYRFDIYVRVGAEKRHHVVTAKDQQSAIGKLGRSYPGKSISLIECRKLAPLIGQSRINPKRIAKKTDTAPVAQKTGVQAL